MEKIDFILTWVDGGDPKWQAEKAKYEGNSVEAKKVAHYRDYGTLKYWFRSVEKYAPWVNKIHFVTCGQTPEWLNTDNPKLNLVSHKDFMPKEYLPTFSINPIELNFHRIEGLEEKFVYFNDDTFLCNEVSQEDFFKKGLPCDAGLFSALIPSVKNEVITYILFNDLLLLNANFNKRACLKGNLSKWLNFKYGKNSFKNLYYLTQGKFSGFTNPHLPNSFLKSTFTEVWEKEGEYLDKVSKNKFRTKEDVNQYLMRYWQLVSGKFVPRSPKIGGCYVVGEEVIFNHLRNKDLKMICINDDQNMKDIDEEMKKLIDVFEEIFPNKSEFEK